MTAPGPESLRRPLPAAGVAVPLLASFAGLAGVPLVALAHNNLSALLRFYPDRVETKVLRRRQRPYDQIRRVGVMTFVATRNVELVWRGTALSFTANVRSDAWRLAVLRLLAEEGAPLSAAARRLLEAG